MNEVLNVIGEITTKISNFVWPLFLPILVLFGVFISCFTIKKISRNIPSKKKLTFKAMIGPASISLGAKIGTGSIIGVLGSLNKLSLSGQGFIEGIALWGLIGAFILIPLTYSETFISRMINKSPVQYIKENISQESSSFYCIALVVLYILGFGGFQFNGIDTVTTITFSSLLGINLTEVQRYIFVIMPIIVVASAIILTKKHKLFINALSGMIGFAVVSYFIFFIVFALSTIEHISVFISRAWIGFTNPVAMTAGVPIGMIFGLQRIIQTSEAGLGTSPLASEENKETGPRDAALTQVIPTAITVVVSLFFTSYITSYGVANGIMNLPSDGIQRLTGYFQTAQSVTGIWGLLVISFFAVLSGITTLLGSYFFLTQLFFNNTENKNILTYIVLIIIAGTLAVFGFDIIFDVVDILLFAVSGLNLLALSIIIYKFVFKKEYSINKDNIS